MQPLIGCVSMTCIQEGKSALILVCERGHISLVLTTLDGGADVNFQQKVVPLL